MLYRSLFLTLSLFVLGCGDAGEPLGPEFDAYEAVIREHAQRVNAPAGRQIVVYLSLDHENPPVAFLRRFAGMPFRVEPARVSQKEDKDVFAVYMSLGVGEWKDSDRVRLMAFIHDETEQPKCGTPWPINVVRRNGCWAVEH